MRAHNNAPPASHRCTLGRDRRSGFAQQPLKLSFQNGRVTVDATSVPVRTILTEWGKVGGTKVVGAERISGAPMTLKLVNVTEAQALETILRSVAGYMAAPRSGATTGPSIYDRILVMATSSTPAPPANAARPSPAQPNAFAGTQRFVPPRQRAEEQEEIEEPDDNQPSPPVFTFPQPPQNMAYPQQPAGVNSRGRRPAGHDRSRAADHHDQSGAGLSCPAATAAGRRAAAGHDGPSAATGSRRSRRQPVISARRGGN